MKCPISCRLGLEWSLWLTQKTHFDTKVTALLYCIWGLQMVKWQHTSPTTWWAPAGSWGAGEGVGTSGFCGRCWGCCSVRQWAGLVQASLSGSLESHPAEGWSSPSASLSAAAGCDSWTAAQTTGHTQAKDGSENKKEHRAHVTAGALQLHYLGPLMMNVHGSQHDVSRGVHPWLVSKHNSVSWGEGGVADQNETTIFNSFTHLCKRVLLVLGSRAK